MTRTWRWVAAAIAVLIAAFVLFLAFFDWNLVRVPVARRISARIARPVKIGHLRLVLLTLHPSVQMRELEVGNPSWAGGGLMAKAQELDIRADLLPLLKGDVVLSNVDVIKPELHLFRDAAGRANWRLGAPGGELGPPQKANQPTKLPVLHQLFIDSGALTVSDQERKLAFSGTFGAAQGGGSRGTQPFRMTGRGSLNNRPFTLQVEGGPLIWAETHKPYPFDVRVVASDIHASARGVVPNPFDLGHLDVTLSIAGNDLADLYYLTGLALPDSPPYELSGHLTRTVTRFDFTHVVGRLGKSDLEGSVLVQVLNDRPQFDADLVSKTLDFADLAPVFGASSSPTVRKHRSLLFPRAPLQLNRVRGMDAAVHYRAESIEVPKLPLREVDLRLRLDHGVLDFEPFSFTLPLGRIAGTARIDASRDVPLTSLDVRLTNVRLSEFRPAGSASPPLEGELLGRLELRGRGDSVHAAASTADGTLTFVVPHGEVDQAFAELIGVDLAKGLDLLLTKKDKKTSVECGVADFDARNGNLQVQQVVFDTKPVLITAKGGINLRRERLDLSIYGHPKQFRILRVKAPILITGTLLHPKVGIKPGSVIAQGAIAAILGAIATPFAAIAAFVDPGLAKNPSCQALLAEAHREGAPLRTAASKSRPKR